MEDNLNKDTINLSLDELKQKIFEYLVEQNVSSIDALPEWILSSGFKFVKEIGTLKQLMDCDRETIILDKAQRELIECFGIENIKELERRTSYFSHKSDFFVEVLARFHHFVSDFEYGRIKDVPSNISSYDDFERFFANYLNQIRTSYDYSRLPDYDWIEGYFREKYKHIFIDTDVPQTLRNAFYRNSITPHFIYGNSELFAYLEKMDLKNVLNVDIKLMPGKVDFLSLYVEKFGNKGFLDLMSKYGNMCSTLYIYGWNAPFKEQEEVDKAFREAITKEIIEKNYSYIHLQDIPEYYDEHQDMFVNFNHLSRLSYMDKKELERRFYRGHMTFDDIRTFPALVEYLKDKNLFVAFSRMRSNDWIVQAKKNRTRIYANDDTPVYSDLELLQMYGNEFFLDLCKKYGNYLEGVNIKLHAFYDIKDGKYVDSNGEAISYEKLTQKIEDVIATECKNGLRPYSPDTVPEFLISNYPELFLNLDMPYELFRWFHINTEPNFTVLQQNKEWLPFLQDKSVMTPMLQAATSTSKREQIKKFFDLFGKKALKLGVDKAETVDMMIKENKVDLMKSWYDLTGGKFIPDAVIMKNFPLGQADKFLSSTSKWSALMKIEHFSKYYESREAMLKLAYAFGVFDNDEIGFQKVVSLFRDIPRHLSHYDGFHVVNFKHNRSLDILEKYQLLYDTLQKEGVKIDPELSIFKQIYRQNEDNTYTLTINMQHCPKSTLLIRDIFDHTMLFPSFSPNKAHMLCGRFNMRYDPTFREFFLSNLDEFLRTSEYNSLLASIFNQFPEMKALNSNRTLTLDLARGYVQKNQYVNVNPGNDGVAEVSAIAGYSQKEFSVLQKIYNFGKQRIFSSIPRIINTYENYSYEILRLDDPLALAIGTLTDCCQEIGNVAEACMEHSMVDKHGRVFAVRDGKNNIVAQSWVWRNKGVLCFDNIEVPEKAFDRAIKDDDVSNRQEFADKIYEIYKQAARELLENDEKTYRELLESGKITKEQYDGLRLSKVTVGLGYNDIAESIQKNASLEKGHITKPLPYVSPLTLGEDLYTNDSKTQYVLDARPDNVTYNGDTLSIYHEDYEIYDASNMTAKTFLQIQKLELLTKGSVVNLDVIADVSDSLALMTEIAESYDLNPETCRIIMNPNFAIIYDTNGDIIRIGDLLFNTFIDNKDQQMDIEDAVVMQIRLAIDQIAKGKNIDVSKLTDYHPKKIYQIAMNLTEELDIERGLSKKEI